MEMQPSAMRAGRPCTAHRVTESARSDTVTQNLNPVTLSGPPRVLGTTRSGPLEAQHLEFHWPVETASLHGHMREEGGSVGPHCTQLWPYLESVPPTANPSPMPMPNVIQSRIPESTIREQTNYRASEPSSPTALASGKPNLCAHLAGRKPTC